MATGAEASGPAPAVACANAEAQPPPPSPAASASSSAAASTVSGDSSSADSTAGRAAGAPVDSVSALAARSQPGSMQLPATSSEGRQRLRNRKRQEAEAGSEAAAAKRPVGPGAALARLQLAQERPHLQDLGPCAAATGEVPSLTARDLEVVAAAQHAARIAATQPVEKCGSCSHCLDPSRKKACRAVLMQRKELMAAARIAAAEAPPQVEPAALAAYRGAEGPRTRGAARAAALTVAAGAGSAAAEAVAQACGGCWSGELPPESEIADVLRDCDGSGGTSAGAGSSCKRTNSPLAATRIAAEGNGGGSSDDVFGGGDSQRWSLLWPRFQPVEKCGSCSHCLDPSRKKACRAVLMQRKELMALRGS
ncbi:hypothetical protein ACK3TF_005267 [Chlorella vulgaris]